MPAQGRPWPPRRAPASPLVLPLFSWVARRRPAVSCFSRQRSHVRAASSARSGPTRLHGSSGRACCSGGGGVSSAKQRAWEAATGKKKRRRRRRRRRSDGRRRRATGGEGGGGGPPCSLFPVAFKGAPRHAPRHAHTHDPHVTRALRPLLPLFLTPTAKREHTATAQAARAHAHPFAPLSPSSPFPRLTGSRHRSRAAD
jgi:hypothetical protein